MSLPRVGAVVENAGGTPMPDSLQRSFSANHSLLLSRTEQRSGIVFMRDDPARSGHRRRDFYQTQIITLSQYWCVFGKVEGPVETYPVIEFVKPDTKQNSAPTFLFLLTAREAASSVNAILGGEKSLNRADGTGSGGPR